MAGLGRRAFLGAMAAGVAGAGMVFSGGVAAAGGRSARGPAPGAVVYLGSYSTGEGGGHGLEVGRVAGGDPAITLGGAVAGVPDASFLALSADHARMYVTNEQDPGKLTALDIGDPANPSIINVVGSGGGAPTHLSVHPGGRHLLSANYGTGSVAVHPIHPDGSLGDLVDLVPHDAGPGKEAHAHQVVTDPSGAWVLAVDLGADSVYVYRFDVEAGKLALHEQVTLPAGAGPRHLAFAPDAAFAYILGEVRAEITIASWDAAAGRLTPVEVVPTVAPDAPAPQYPSELALTADGRFLYVANRNETESTVAAFTVTGGGRRIEPAGQMPSGGEWPRHLTLSPDERWVYVSNQRAGNVSWLPRDPDTGTLGHPAGSVPVASAAIAVFPARPR